MIDSKREVNNVDQFYQNSPHYKIVWIFLSTCGLWPFHTANRRCVIYLVMLMVLGSGITFQILGVKDIWNDIFELVDTMPLLLLAILSVIKLVIAMCMLPKIQLLLIKMREYCLSQKSFEETKIHTSYTLYGRNLCYAYTGLVFGQVLVFNVATLLTRFIHVDTNVTLSNKARGAQLGVAYRVNYLVDLDKYYIPIYIHTTMCCVSYMFLIVAFDVLYMTLIHHCCGFFGALRYRLEYALEVTSDGMTTKTKCYSNIVYSIRRHTEAMDFVATVDEVFSLQLFCHVGATIFALSVLGYQVVTNTDNVNRLLKHSMFLSGLIMNIFFENWLGQKIIDSSEKVFDATCKIKWYSMSVSERNLLIMVIMKSKQPLILTASKLIVLSYVTFSAVMRTSSSYFMLLRSAQ